MKFATILFFISTAAWAGDTPDAPPSAVAPPPPMDNSSRMQPMTMPPEMMGTRPSIVPPQRRGLNDKSPYPIPEQNRNTPPPEAQPQKMD